MPVGCAHRRSHHRHRRTPRRIPRRRSGIDLDVEGGHSVRHRHRCAGAGPVTAGATGRPGGTVRSDGGDIQARNARGDAEGVLPGRRIRAGDQAAAGTEDAVRAAGGLAAAAGVATREVTPAVVTAVSPPIRTAVAAAVRQTRLIPPMSSAPDARTVAAVCSSARAGACKLVRRASPASPNRSRRPVSRCHRPRVGPGTTPRSGRSLTRRLLLHSPVPTRFDPRDAGA